MNYWYNLIALYTLLLLLYYSAFDNERDQYHKVQLQTLQVTNTELCF